MILNKIKLIAVISAVSLIAYDLGVFENRTTPEEFCEEHFLKANNIIEARLSNPIKEDGLNILKEVYGFDDNDVAGNKVLNKLINEAYSIERPDFSNERNELIKKFESKTYHKCYVLLDDMKYGKKERGGVFELITTGVSDV